jgi:GDP-4-dehydro-6-deoxy-D-mannose reductase
MRFIVTGVGGFIGSHLADFCLSGGHDVYGTLKPGNGIENITHLLEDGKPSYPGFNFDFIDIRDSQRMFDLIKQFQPDGIFHMAAQSYVQPSWEDPNETFETNINGTVNVFEPVKKLGLSTRIVVACSSAEYGTFREEDVPIKETLPLQPLHPYGISKVGQDLLARQYFLNFGVDTIRLRYFNQTGIRKVKDACADFSMKVAEIDAGVADPVINVGNLDTARDIQDIRDTVKATWLAFEKGEKGEVYNACTGIPTRIRDVLSTLLGFTDKEIEVNENTADKLRFQDEPIILGDNSKLREATGFVNDYTIQDTLKDMFEFWKAYYLAEDKSTFRRSLFLPSLE